MDELKQNASIINTHININLKNAFYSYVNLLPPISIELIINVPITINANGIIVAT